MESWSSECFGLVNENVRHPKVVNGFSIDVNKFIFAQRHANDSLIFPIHAQRRFKGDVLRFLVDFENVAQVQRNVHLLLEMKRTC